VDAWVDAVAGARIQLIKRDDTRTRGDLHLYLASTRQAKPCVAELRLPELAALRDVDLGAAIAALRNGEIPAGARAPGRPLALVCTNGKRDRCCAKWGVPVFDSIRGRNDVDVWQTTHLGGHRFAATMLWLPEGLCYGRISVGEAAGILEAALTRRIDPLERLRGRTSLGGAGQAAEYLLRRDHDALGFDDVEVIAEQQEDGRVRVDARVRGTPTTMVLASEPTGASAPGSCGKPAEPIERWTAIG
ncbi:MAG TPA: sucrase ferredoxin, partial [Nannocystaceae bacterium]|nr:sucrase ferredoxin [Nannocystaceae bacterium]